MDPEYSKLKYYENQKKIKKNQEEYVKKFFNKKCK